MTKTLTDKWREGTLKDDEYYIKHVDGRVLTDWFNGHEFRGLYKIDIEEVLAPVPSYEEYRLLKKEIDSLKEQMHSMLFTDDVVQERYDKAEMKIHILEHQLEIATKVLEYYTLEDAYVSCYNNPVNPNPMVARKALKEMEGVK